jgi:hypothetical protein
MVWVRASPDMTLAEALELSKKGKGMLIIRKVIRRGEKPIQFWLWVD